MKIFKSAPLWVLIFTVAFLCYYFTKAGEYKADAANSESCVGCHEMQPAYYTWKATAHSSFKCDKCHKNIDMKIMRQRHESGFVYPVKMKTRMSNEVCNQCHSSKRDISPPGDLIIPHQFHMDKGIYCIDCHSAVVHADSLERYLEPKVVEAAKFTEADARKLTSQGNRVIMAKCMDCHNGKMATKECAPCHKVLRLPANHQAQDWGYNHGGATFADLNSCVRCHSEEYIPPKGFQIKDASTATISTFARNNKFCQDCHSQRPATHGPLFTATHPADAKAFRQGCYVCHDTKKPADSGKIGQASTEIHCYNCHTTKHPANFRETHKAQVAAVGKERCLTCHDEVTSCIACHQKK
ncbi:MAG TPA: cytochrome c3 family protein [Bacillota bacterium]|nr:cytochrome c3 family protein [Bacillota bacterium]